MTYRYSMNGSHHATVYRETGDELVAVAFMTSRNLSQPADIAAIARATVAALNGTTAEPRVVWHPKAVEALRAADAQASSGRYGDSPESDEAEALMQPDARQAWRLIREALTLVDQPPAEKVVGYSIIRDGGVAWTLLGKTIADARRVARKDDLVARLVEEPTP